VVPGLVSIRLRRVFLIPRIRRPTLRIDCHDDASVPISSMSDELPYCKVDGRAGNRDHWCVETNSGKDVAR
jgi:hypothetical protein